MQRQNRMALDDCAGCRQTILPGEPYKQTAWVDIIGNRVVSSKPKTFHLDGHCPGEQADAKE